MSNDTGKSNQKIAEEPKSPGSVRKAPKAVDSGKKPKQQ